MAGYKKRGKKKWIQEARERMEAKGTVGSYGHHSVAQMKRDKAKGGKIGKKANFALNVRKRKRARKRS
jgi:hypothetical protein